LLAALQVLQDYGKLQLDVSDFSASYNMLCDWLEGGLQRAIDALQAMDISGYATFENKKHKTNTNQTTQQN